MKKKQRFVRGQQHPECPELYFFRYHNGKERWLPIEVLNHKRRQSVAASKKWNKTPTGKACRRRATKRTNERHKEYHSAYYKQAHVRQRIKERRDKDPKILAKRAAREQWRKERAAFRETQEYKDRVKASQKKYREKWKASGKSRAYYAKKREDSQYRLAQSMRSRIHYALKSQRVRKTDRTFDLIGCSVEALRVHLQAQFKEGMTWEGYGPLWHVDHKLPCRMFDLSNPEHQRICFHFENLQPLWGPENHRKSDKLPDGTSARQLNIIPFKQALGG